MKLKLNTGQSVPLPPPFQEASQTPATPATPGLKLNFRKPSISLSTSTPTPVVDSKPKRTPSTKKRARDEVDVEPTPLSKKLKTPGTKKTTLKLKSNKPTAPARLKITKKGKIQQRPLGVGYDSEAEDAEEDPAIEENFVLRMEPGSDCDYLRDAIINRKIGIPPSAGGADITLRWFSRDARRAAITIQGRHYAAVMLDLPCIVESMKSWDKKGWWKSADICQILVVVGRVNSEDAAREAPLPRFIDSKTWQWPHGLTPPMHSVRERRFRKRVSYRTIEAAEEEVERQLAQDALTKNNGGYVEWKVLDLSLEGDESEEHTDYDEEEDELAAPDEIETEAEESDDEDLAAQMARELAEEGVDDDDASSAAVPLQTNDSLKVQAQDPASEAASSDQVTSPADGQDAVASNTTPAGEEEDFESDEDDDDEEIEEEDEQSKERNQHLLQQQEDIKDLEKGLALERQRLSNTTNPLQRARYMTTIKNMESDLEVKKRDIGQADDE